MRGGGLHTLDIGRGFHRIGRVQHQRELRQQIAQVLQCRVEGNAAFSQLPRMIKQRVAILCRQCIKQVEQIITPHRAKHGLDRSRFHRAAAVGNRLIRERQRITHAARSGARQQVQRSRFSVNILLLQHFAQMLRHQRRRHRLQIELQAARQHRHRNFLRVGGGENEFHMGGRLFQRFQHGVECRLRQHVHFVDDVDLVTPHRRCVLRVVEHLAHVVDAGVRRRIQLQQIDKTSRIDLGAGRTDAARGRRHTGFAVKTLGQNPRQRGLAHPACARQQIGMMQPPLRQRIRQRLHHVLLPLEIGKRARPPLARERKCGGCGIAEKISHV